MPLAAPRRPRREQLGTRGRDHEERLRDLFDQALDEIEQRLVRPVEVLQEEDDGALGRHLRQECDPGGVQVLPSRERVELSGDVQAERQAEDLLAREASQDALRRVCLQQPQLLAEDVRECAIGRTPPGREAASGAPQRLGRLRQAGVPRAPARAATCRLPRRPRP